MIWILRCLLAAALLIVCSLSAATQEQPAIHAQIQSARRLIAAGRFAAAIQTLLPVLTSARGEKAGDRETVGEILNDLGYAYRMKGECQNAIDTLSGAMRELRGPAGAAIAGVNLAGSYLDCGQAERAGELWGKTLAPLAAASAPEAAARLWAAGGAIEAVLRRYDASDSLYSRAIAIWERAAEPAGERVALAHVGRAVDRACLRRFDEANADAVNWPALERSAAAVRAAALGNIALVRFLSGRMDEARVEFAAALRLLGASPECSCAPAILANYAAFLSKSGDRTGAKAAALRAAELARRFAMRASGEAVDVRVLEGTAYRGPE